jgi:hypothetical protein
MVESGCDFNVTPTCEADNFFKDLLFSVSAVRKLKCYNTYTKYEKPTIAILISYQRNYFTYKTTLQNMSCILLLP